MKIRKVKVWRYVVRITELREVDVFAPTALEARRLAKAGRFDNTTDAFDRRVTVVAKAES